MKAIVIRSSEDGNIAVASNKKEAFRIYKEYIESENGLFKGRSFTYNVLCDRFKEYRSITVEVAGWYEIEFTVFEINKF